MTQHFPTADGFMTGRIRSRYIKYAIEAGLLPSNAHDLPEIKGLTAPADQNQPIQFWQLFSRLGPDRIVKIVGDFYVRVYEQEPWFKDVFEAVSGIGHHINTQASMWADCMGGGPYYHGGEFRLNFHHTHNAMALMNAKGATLWADLMKETLDHNDALFRFDPRIRPAINTFLSYFMDKYATDFGFENGFDFGPVNPKFKT